MAVLECIENRVKATLMATLAQVGSPSTDWLTLPNAPIDGAPADAQLRPTAPAMFVVHAQTSSEDGDAAMGTKTHYWRVRFSVVLHAATYDDVRRLKADVVRALFRNENAFTAAYGQPMYFDDYVPRDDMASAGVPAGVVSIHVDCHIDHLSP